MLNFIPYHCSVLLATLQCNHSTIGTLHFATYVTLHQSAASHSTHTQTEHTHAIPTVCKPLQIIWTAQCSGWCSDVENATQSIRQPSNAYYTIPIPYHTILYHTILYHTIPYPAHMRTKLMTMMKRGKVVSKISVFAIFCKPRTDGKLPFHLIKVIKMRRRILWHLASVWDPSLPFCLGF